MIQSFVLNVEMKPMLQDMLHAGVDHVTSSFVLSLKKNATVYIIKKVPIAKAEELEK